MKYMIDGSSSAPVPKARRWLVQYPEASNTLLQLLTTKTIDYLVAQVKAGAQVSVTGQHWESWSISASTLPDTNLDTSDVSLGPSY